MYQALHALVIGVGHHADAQNALAYARSDAELVATVLATEFGFTTIHTLYDDEATRARIQACFEYDLQAVHEDDGVVIFFAGHGVTTRDAFGVDRGFLVPHDGDPTKPLRNLSMSHLRDEWLPMVPAKHVFLIVDACYGGLALRDVQTTPRPTSADAAVIAELTRTDRKVRQVLSAGGRGQRVLDGGLYGRSVFTGHLIQALREADPYTFADRVGALVKERVARDSQDRGHPQVPAFGYVAGSDGSFVFHKRAPNHREQTGALVTRPTPHPTADKAPTPAAPMIRTDDDVDQPPGETARATLQARRPSSRWLATILTVATIGVLATMTVPRPQPERPRLGVGVAPVAGFPEDVREAVGLPALGLIVTEVRPGSGAEAAGVVGPAYSAQVHGEAYPAGGDVIVSIDGTPVPAVEDLQRIVFA